MNAAEQCMALGNRIIREIDDRYGFLETGRVIQWADDNYSNEWSNSIDRLDRALSSCLERFDYESLAYEYKVFRSSVSRLMLAYDEKHGSGDADQFLKSIRENVVKDPHRLADRSSEPLCAPTDLRTPSPEEFQEALDYRGEQFPLD